MAIDWLKTICLFAIFSIAHSVIAQSINYSTPEKTSLKNFDYSILGKTSDGILIYKYNAYENIMECYDELMNKKWEHAVNFVSKSAAIEHISICNNKVVVFFSVKRNNFSYLYAQGFDASLKQLAKAIKVDSVEKTESIKAVFWQLSHSQDYNYYLIKCVTNIGTENFSVHLQLLDNNFNAQWSKTTDLEGNQNQLIFLEPNNDGQAIGILAANTTSENGKIGTSNFEKLRLIKWDKERTKPSKRWLLTNEFQFSSLACKYDDISHSIVIAGCFQEPDQQKTKGFGLIKYNIELDTLTHFQFEAFQENTLRDIAFTPDADINNFGIKNLVLKFDGGVMVFGESVYSTTQTVETASYTMPSIPTVRTYTYYHNDDMIMVEWDNKGIKIEEKLLRKKQTTDKPSRYYSSFGIMNEGNKIQLLFNDDVSEQANLMSYSHNKNHIVTRNSIYGSRQKNLFLSPGNGVQVSAFEYIIPSQFKGYLQFMKIDF
jgi:hypothetical protein